MAEWVRAALQQSHRHIPSIRRAQDGAHVSGVLDPVQQQHSLFRDKGLLFRQTAQKHRPLGGLHGGNCLHDLFAHPDNPNVLRQLYLHTIAEEGRLQTWAVHSGLFQQLGPIGDEKPCRLPGLPGGQQLSHLLHRGIFPGCNSFFRHSFCTFSRAMLSPSTTMVSPWQIT